MGALLQWTAEAEHNFDRYEIGRSFDSRNFSNTWLVKERNERQYGFVDILSAINGITVLLPA